MEDWDSETGYTEDTKCNKTENFGRTFGSRGRGFIRNKVECEGDNFRGGHRGFERKFHDANWHKTNNNKNNNNEWNLNEGFKDSYCRNGGGDMILNKKAKSKYIPDAPTEDDDEIFGNGISTGINFKNYDSIEVKISGENYPSPIRSFEESGLMPEILRVIERCNYSSLTPIQKFAIPIVLNGRDMMACAQTGSGKTAAFLIPIINRLLQDGIPSNSGSCCQPQALILSPTRELTIQIFNEARKFARETHLKLDIVYGGTSIMHQIKSIKSSSDCNILVATVGRLLDFVARKIVDFSRIHYLVLDEADRMLDMGFLPQIKEIISHPTMPDTAEKQTLMFSATFPEEVQRLASMFLNDYLFVAVGIVGGACSDVEQRFFSLNKFEKRNKLVELLKERGSSKCLVFVELKRMADFIATFLCEKDFPATSIHGDREQREREEALRDFKSGRMNILVATSVAARGLDIKNVSHVLNFDLPNSIDEYVHRIGRTGRVGNRGLATSFYDPKRDAQLAPSLVKILTQAGQEVPDFLRADGGGYYTGEVASNFGGNDIRQNNYGSIKEETFEDEQW